MVSKVSIRADIQQLLNDPSHALGKWQRESWERALAEMASVDLADIRLGYSSETKAALDALNSVRSAAIEYPQHDLSAGQIEIIDRIRATVSELYGRIVGSPNSWIQRALILDEHDDEDQEFWNIITILQWLGSEDVLHAANALCQSNIPRERKLGAFILGQLGVPERSFPQECFNILAQRLEIEMDHDVLYSICSAFGHLHDARAIPLVVAFKNHPDHLVRYGVINALTGHENDLAINGLIELSRDEDQENRDWATFGLGSQIDSDTPEIREALLARIRDEDSVVRGEALVGLAHRHDKQVIDALIHELKNLDDVEYMPRYLIGAAQEIGNPDLYPLLLDLRDRLGWDEEHYLRRDLDEVIELCKPQA